MPDSQTPPNLPEFKEPRFTAEQIGKDCPAHLQKVGEEITRRFLQAQEQAKVLYDQVVELKKLVAEAKELCDDGGFRAFQKKFFPDLSKYELLAIGTNKKSVEEIRASTRARVAKSRANKAAAPNSATVTDKSKSEPCTQGAPNEHGEIEAPGIASEQTPEPSKCPSTVASAAAADSGTDPEKSGMQDAPTEDGVVEHPSTAAGQTPEPSKPWRARASDEGMRIFTAHTTGLNKATKKRPPEHFSETTVSVEILEQLEHLFASLARLKRANATKPTPVGVLSENGTASVGQPTEHRQHAAPEASIDGVALHEYV